MKQNGTNQHTAYQEKCLAKVKGYWKITKKYNKLLKQIHISNSKQNFLFE